MFASKDTLLTRPSGGYTIARSVRLRSSATAYLNRTPATASNRKTWTWSGWVKRGALGVYSPLFVAGTTNGQQVGSLAFSSAGGTYDKLELNFGVQGTSTEFWLQTTAVYRDPAAWYHIVCAVDTTQATASNRVKFYVNGTQITALGAYASYSQYPSQNYDTSVNNAVQHLISRDQVNTAGYYDGYLTEINFIDGQALTPSSFGSTNAITGVWQPAKYTGTYGTNGFYLNFSDNSSNTATTIGKDYSGNGNNWTPNNISVTAGATYDSMVDSPTVGSLSSNYAVLNPLENTGNTVSSGNLSATSGSNWYNTKSTISMPSGKWYCEFVHTTAVNYTQVGVFKTDSPLSTSTYYSFSANGWAYSAAFGELTNNNNFTSGFPTSAVGDVISVAVDIDAGKIWFGKNGTWFSSGNPASGTNAAYTNLSGAMSFVVGVNSTAVINANFGQRPFSYTPPTGFVALNTYNLPASTITNGAAYMAATLYTGNGSTQTVNNSTGFYPDFNWIKARNNVGSNVLVNSVVGGTKQLFSNLTNAEQTDTNITNGISSSGIALGNNSSGTGSTNQNTYTYVLWQWLAGGGTSSSNTNGSITSTVSAGATQGFSVVTYTSTTGTVGHGLGVAPSMIIMKPRNNTDQWTVGHAFTNNGSSPWNYGLALNAASAQDANSGFWSNTAPTSTVFSQGSWNSGFTKVAYCFAAVAGYSAFGSYTGNGSADGPFVYTGFRPRFIIIKGSSFASNWFIEDSSRNGYNVNDGVALRPNLSSPEDATTTYNLDILSNGFKLRSSAADSNTSTATFIWAAFAESPFKTSLAR